MGCEGDAGQSLGDAGSPQGQRIGGTDAARRFLDPARLIALAQVFLSLLFLVGYFVVLIKFLRGDIHTPDNWKDTLGTLLGVITGSVTTIIAFWFSRSRTVAQ